MHNSTSYIEIDSKALQNNFNFLKKYFGENVRISSVVKGNAYGHGIKTIVPIACNSGIDHFSVFSTKEAYEVKNSCRDKYDLMIMGMIDLPDEIEWAIQNDIEFYVFDIDRLKNVEQISKKLKKIAKVHLEIETGMNRTGIPFKQLEKVLEILENNVKNIKVKGLCTHYAGAESIANYMRIQKQIKLYNKIYDWLIQKGITPEIKHTACSAAAMSYPKIRMDMVRIGIMQYGFWSSRETYINYISKKEDKIDPLKRVITWKSQIMAIKEVKEGEFVGYGTTFIANNNMKVAIVPVGYAYGYSRSLSNHGRVLIHGKRLSVIGMVNMNMTAIDVTEIPEVKKGDEVVLIGEQDDLSVSVASFSELSSLLNYELLTRLPHDIPRIIVG